MNVPNLKVTYAFGIASIRLEEDEIFIERNLMPDEIRQLIDELSTVLDLVEES